MNSIYWDSNQTRPTLGELVGNHEADLVVVGLGGSGLTAVLHAAHAGLRVIGIDAAHIAGGAGGRNGGFLLAGIAMFYHEAVAKFGATKAKALYQHTLDEFVRMEQTTPAAINRCGVLRQAFDESEVADCQAHLTALSNDGFDGSWFSGEQGEGLLIESDGVFHPVARAIALAKLAVAAGAELFINSPVQEITDTTVHTKHGTISAKNLLVAVDGRLEVLLPELHTQVRTTRLQMAATSANPKLKLQYPVYSRFGYDYWQQFSDGSVALGGGRDKFVDDEWTTSDEPTTQMQDYLTTRLASVGADSKIVHRWAATVSYTPTGLPLAREVHPNLWAIGGYCGTGNIVGALLARSVVDQVVHGHSQVLADFQP
jgi:glycine/D-amino acid oxidase-like deaminating enzyme